MSVQPEVLDGVPEKPGSVHLLKETPQGWPDWLPAFIHETIHGLDGEPYLEAIIQYGGKAKTIPDVSFDEVTFSERIERPEG